MEKPRKKRPELRVVWNNPAEPVKRPPEMQQYRLLEDEEMLRFDDMDDAQDQRAPEKDVPPDESA